MSFQEGQDLYMANSCPPEKVDPSCIECLNEATPTLHH
jgi:hypothetical protein